MLQNPSTTAATGQQQMPQPKLVVIRRRPNQGFGFTLRHFIAYPPEDDPSWPQEASEPYQVKAMETIFIKEVHPNGPAYYANLQTGDRVLMVNNTPIAGIAYSTIVSMIKQTPSELKLLVVPKECDVLQMHFTSMAHTSQSNVGNGNTASSTSASNSTTNSSSSSSCGALLPLSVARAGKLFPPQLSHQHQLISYPASQQASRSGSITSANSLRPLTSSDYMELATAQQSYQQQQQQQQQQQRSGNIITQSDSGSYLCSPPANLTVLTRQQQLQQQQNAAALYASNAAVDNSDLMIRLRESIKQKEEFLKSPLPNVHHQQQQQHSQQQQHHQQQQQQHFFPSTPPSSSLQLSMISTSSTSVGSSGLGCSGRGTDVVGNNATTIRGRTLVKQPLSTTSSSSSTRELLTESCDMHYAPNLGSSTTAVLGGGIGGVSSGGGVGLTTYGSSGTSSTMTRSHHHQQQQQRTISSLSGSKLRDKYDHKDYEFLETLQETGVTNKVFESKLNSHLSRGFDPFKPLSINTNAIDSSAAGGNVVMVKKQAALYDSLQRHAMHQVQPVQQQQQHHPQLHHMTAQKITFPTSATSNSFTTTTPNQASVSSVDGQRFSRMEIHKASLATATIDHQQNSKYSSKLADVNEKPTLADIAESGTSSSTSTTNVSALTDINKTTTTPVVRRFRPMSSLDETKSVRRISYLRATNDEYHCETSPSSSITNTSTGSIADSLSTKSTVLSQQIDEHPDPIYDVVGGDSGAADSTSESFNVLDDLKPDTSSRSSRRTSVNSDIRHSVHIDCLASMDVNGKFETKDVATEMEIFETEMEIKSSCINGKRLSEYRSWRQVKIEIKGDILKIYPSRSSKSDNNIIELDIRNYKIFEEPDKKKYVFRMQSKPLPIATLGNELNIDDVNDKLTSSGSSTSALHSLQGSSSEPHYHPHTEILFKTKSVAEMKRIFGLVQWKNSLIYDDNDLQGRQLAEPQKTAATASMMSTAGTYCDDNVQQQSGQNLHGEHSPISSTSRNELEAPDSISPVMKTRKSSSSKNIPDKDLGSPKTKNWRDLIFRRGGGSSSGHNADLSPSNVSSSKIGSIGVFLKSCPMSKNNEYVPTIVDVCTNIVETKGLGVVGIYRIPGNKAAISELSDQVNKADFSWDLCNTDVRWEDVNVVSSLLKLFIRSLPDALLPCYFYNLFIEADKLLGMDRMTELKKLLEKLLEHLPPYSYHTMKHLFRHLNRVSKNCNVNLMEPKNLAIIFGPSIIRTPNDTLDIAVKDMKHQCRIVELLLTHYDYFFEDGPTPDIEDVCGNNLAASSSSSTTGSTAAAAAQQMKRQQQQEDQTNMLLHNISKIERLTDNTSRTSRFNMPQLGIKSRNKIRTSSHVSGSSVASLDYSKSTSSAITTASSSSSSSNTAASSTTSNSKKMGKYSLHNERSHVRKGSLDEKDSCSRKVSAELQRKSVDISITLTDDESSISRISDPGSMSLGIVTDTLDSKLSKLRSGSESNDENESPDFPITRRYTMGEPLLLHSENIPYADESPERYYHNFCPPDNITGNNLKLSRSCASTNILGLEKPTKISNLSTGSSNLTTTYKTANKLQHSATAPINSSMGSVGGGLTSPPTAASTPTTTSAMKGNLAALTARNLYATSKNLRFSSSVQEQRCSEDDSEGSTTSDPKEALVMASPSFLLDKYNKKRRDHRLFRSASFNCRNYSSRYGSTGGGNGGANMPATGLTKDEKTDMNLTKKRQIQNKQNRSIKRRHTVGGPHDYSNGGGGGASNGPNNCNHHCKNNSATTSNNSTNSATTTTLPTAVVRRSANGNIPNINNNHNNNNNNNIQHDEGCSTSTTTSNGNNSSSSNSSNSTTNNAATVNVSNSTGEHVLEVGIRIKNINRGRF